MPNMKMQSLDSLLPTHGTLDIAPDTTSTYHFMAYNKHGYTAGVSHTVDVAAVENKTGGYHGDVWRQCKLQVENEAL